MSIHERINAVQAAVAEAAVRAGRRPQDITIVAVSKTVDRAAVDATYECGIRHFGENRVQDARAKFAVPLPRDATLHMVGQLQSNKARQAVGLFDLIESVDRPSLIDALEHEVRKGAERAALLSSREAAVEPLCSSAPTAPSVPSAPSAPPLPVLLQVNIAGEEQKAGCAPADVPTLIDQIVASPHLALRGLMTIAPLVEDAEQVRPIFRRLREMRDALRRDHPDLTLDVLSMGMTNDYPIAIEEGATHIRIGRAIFADEQIRPQG